MGNPRFKVVSSNSIERFEERLHDFLDSLAKDDVIVEISFATAPLSDGGVEFSALVHYQRTESW